MGKKFIKKDVVDSLLSTNTEEEKQDNIKTEKNKNLKTEKQKDIEIEDQNNKVKVTLYLSRDSDILIDEIRKVLNRNRKSGKISRSDVVSMALKEFSQKLGIN